MGWFFRILIGIFWVGWFDESDIDYQEDNAGVDISKQYRGQDGTVLIKDYMDESELGVEIMNYSKVSLIKLNFSSPQAYYNPPLTPTIID
jgi:hypothetical protein